jgi:hypothetical protein
MALGLALAFVGLAAVMPASVFLGLVWTGVASALALCCGYHFFSSFGPSRAPARVRRR